MDLKNVGIAVAAWAVLSVSAVGAARDQADRPNIVVLFADDLGYGDLGCYGNPTIRTPNLDRMAAEGLKLTQFYAAAPACSPSRAALLTGRLPLRSGLTRVLFPQSDGGIQDGEVTLAEGLKSRGYDTQAIGKWHLGHLPRYLPTRHGFDHYFGLPYSNDMIVDNEKRRDPPLPLMRDESIAEAPAVQETLTPRYTDEAVRFLRAHGRGAPAHDTPFFLYLPYSFPHVPLHASEAQRGKSPRGLYGDVVEELDTSVGRVLQTLRDEGLAERTLVVFSSDNGPWLVKRLEGGSAGLLREGKGSTWEGGMREPCIAWWPGTIAPGRLSTDLACTMDLFTTCLTLAGASVPADRPIDGVSLVPLLKGQGHSPRTVMPFFNRETFAAVRKGPWKLHRVTNDPGSPDPKRREPVKRDPPLLFHLEHDPSERFDVAKDHPEVVADLLREYERIEREMTRGALQH